MNYLNCEFFDEFKSLDSLCRDIYGASPDHKLGVTMYLEDMERSNYLGAFKIPNWKSDYDKLKRARNLRNDLAHSRESFSIEICTQEDVDFVRSFRFKILNQIDPIALLRKQLASSRTVSRQSPKTQNSTNRTSVKPIQHSTGCLGVVALLVLIVASITAALLYILA